MKLKIFFVRKIKGIFLKWKLHKLLLPFNNLFMNLAYLPQFSKWRAEHSDLQFNDFYTLKFSSEKRIRLYEFLIKAENLYEPIDYMEFGVYFGRTFEWWLKNNTHKESSFIGFDTFEGLPENWDVYKKGDMTTEGFIPSYDDNRYEMKKGLFQDALPIFLTKYEVKNRKVIHIDADLYTSTLFVLASLAPYLRKDDIIIFDEFGVPTHEFKAFKDFVSAFYIKYKVIAASNNYFQLALKIE